MYQQFLVLDVTTYFGQICILGTVFIAKFDSVFDGVTTEWGLQNLCMELALISQMLVGQRRERVISDQMLSFLLFVLQLLRAPAAGCSSVP